MIPSRRGKAELADRTRAVVLPWLYLLGLAWITLLPCSGVEADEVQRRAVLWGLSLIALAMPQALVAGARLFGRVAMLALCGCLLVEGLSAWFALHPSAAWFGAPERGLSALDRASWWLLVLALGGALGAAPTRIRPLVTALLGLSAILAASAIVIALHRWEAGETWQRVSGVLGNPNFLAAVLAPLAVLSLWRCGESAGVSVDAAHAARWSKYWPAWLTLLLVATLLLTGGRGAILGVLVGAATLCTPGLHRVRRQQTQTTVIAALAVILAASVLFVALLAQRSASIEIRLQLYQAASLAPLQQQPLINWLGEADPQHSLRPWLGFGADNLEVPLTRLRSIELNPLESRGFDRLADRSHSIVFDRWLAGGAIGLLANALLLLAILRRVWQKRGPTTLGLAAAWLAVATEAMFGVPSAAADLFAAILIAMVFASLRDSNAGENANSAPVAASARRWAFAVSAAGIALVLGAAYLLSAAQHAFWRGQLAADIGKAPESECQSELYEPAENATLRLQPFSVLPVLRAFERQPPPCTTDPAGRLAISEFLVRAAPSMPRAWLQHGRALLEQGQLPAATSALMQALRLRSADPAPEQARALGYFWAAIASQIGSTDPTLASQSASEALRLLVLAGAEQDRAWFRTVAFLQAQGGDYEAAIGSYESAVKLDPRDAASRRNLQRLLDHFQSED